MHTHGGHRRGCVVFPPRRRHHHAGRRCVGARYAGKLHLHHQQLPTAGCHGLSAAVATPGVAGHVHEISAPHGRRREHARADRHEESGRQGESTILLATQTHTDTHNHEHAPSIPSIRAGGCGGCYDVRKHGTWRTDSRLGAQVAVAGPPATPRPASTQRAGLATTSWAFVGRASTTNHGSYRPRP